MFGWSGEVGGRGKIIRVGVCGVWIIWPREKPGKPPKSFFEFLTLLTRHRFSFFVPETLNPIFLENTKRRAPENDRDLSYQKLIWSHMMPFGVNSDPSFRAQKQRIRVRGCVFSYRRDSSEPGKNCVFMKHLMFWLIWQSRGFWQDRSVRKHGAKLYGSRVSNFLSHRRVKA